MRYRKIGKNGMSHQTRNGENTKVTYFLGEASYGDLTLNPPEVDGARWFSLEELPQLKM